MATLTTRSQEVLEAFPPTSFVFRLSTTGRYLEVRQPPDEKRLWTAAGEHIGKMLENILPEPLAAPRRFYFDRAVATKEPQLYGYVHPTTPGRWMACQIVPIVENGEVEEVVMEVYDIAPFSRIGAPYVVHEN